MVMDSCRVEDIKGSVIGTELGPATWAGTIEREADMEAFTGAGKEDFKIADGFKGLWQPSKISSGFTALLFTQEPIWAAGRTTVSKQNITQTDEHKVSSVYL